jgi:hydroxymethylbilane synthase
MAVAIATLRLGTRGSRLALAQAQLAADALSRLSPHCHVEIVQVRTVGDDISEQAPSGKWTASDGQFTSELENALVRGQIDAALHSLKDLPTDQHPGLAVAAVLERGDPHDCLLSAHAGGLANLPFGARIGTSSVRRAAQLAVIRPDLMASPIRGNVDTRLRRLRAGEYDGLLLAAVALNRLGLHVSRHALLPYTLMLPAPGQAALALQVRASDVAVVNLVAELDHLPTRIAVDAERSLLRSIGGGCLSALGTLATVSGRSLRLRAAYEGRDGTARVDLSGPVGSVDEIVAEAAERILRVASTALT